MATRTHYIKSWNANFALNTANESNVAHADYKNTIEVYFTGANPQQVEVQYEHANLDVLTGYLRFYQKASADRGWVEITNADALPEPIPVPLDSADGNNTVYLLNFTGYGLKILIDTTATVGTCGLSLSLRR